MSQKKPAHELLGVLKGGGKEHKNLALLKATLKIKEALEKNGEDPNMFLTDESKALLEEDELRAKLKSKATSSTNLKKPLK